MALGPPQISVASPEQLMVHAELEMLSDAPPVITLEQ
jgi:hypothetical protein